MFAQTPFLYLFFYTQVFLKIILGYLLFKERASASSFNFLLSFPPALN